MINIILVGCVLSTETALLHLLQKHKNGELCLSGIVTKKKSKFNSDYVNITLLAEENNVPVLCWEEYPNEADIIEWVRSKNPDLIFVIGWSKILGDLWIDCFRGKLIGFHPSKLPSNRGRHPIIWSIALGLRDTASTFFMLNKNVDDGNVLSQIDIPILYEDDSATIYAKICKVMVSQIDNIISKNSAIFLDALDAPCEVNINYWRRRSFDDGEIDWRMPSVGIYNLVRALRHPYPGAHFFYKDKKITVWRCEEIEYQENNIEPGKIIDVVRGVVIVKTGSRAVGLVEYDPMFLPIKGEYLL